MAAVKAVVEEVENPASEISVEDAQQYAAAPSVGDSVRMPVDMNKFGRIATQTAKQVIIQGIREAERGMIVEEYSGKMGEIITAQAVRVDTRYGSVLLDLGGKRDRTEVMLPAQEQLPGENITEGDRVKVYVVEVRAAGKGPQIMLSR
ncbi:MAG: NusA N-terminal domain-containing protein, partial [Angelakisella sp.]